MLLETETILILQFSTNETQKKPAYFPESLEKEL